ncbi:hypothetical protein E2C01_087784 [Portunus trituberculatus]|uniref:Uncharacterized protein n=1 Tax=Portunus trituberculatus TaxID=210409 RepID=A0A5B7J7J9_PORTR|nr:hypothetical protein [Portunus trituberculatus]
MVVAYSSLHHHDLITGGITFPATTLITVSFVTIIATVTTPTRLPRSLPISRHITAVSITTILFFSSSPFFHHFTLHTATTSYSPSSLSSPFYTVSTSPPLCITTLITSIPSTRTPSPYFPHHFTTKSRTTPPLLYPQHHHYQNLPYTNTTPHHNTHLYTTTFLPSPSITPASPMASPTPPHPTAAVIHLTHLNTTTD